MIAVIAFTDMESVRVAKTGAVMGVGNTPVSATPAISTVQLVTLVVFAVVLLSPAAPVVSLRAWAVERARLLRCFLLLLLFRLSLLSLFLLLLLNLGLLRRFLFLLLFRLGLLLLFLGLSFLFVLLLQRVCGNHRSENKEQNSCANKSDLSHKFASITICFVLRALFHGPFPSLSRSPSIKQSCDLAAD